MVTSIKSNSLEDLPKIPTTRATPSPRRIAPADQQLAVLNQCHHLLRVPW